MPSVGLNIDITPLVNAMVAGNTDQMTGITRQLLEPGTGASELIGRVGMIAAHGDSEGHIMLTLAAASMMSRWFIAWQHLLGQDLQRQVEQSKFRDDLYYRLNVINIHMPPLRDRKEDIPSLVEHFLAKHRYSATAQPAAISEEAIRRLMEYNWPGNVRELENVIERAVVLSRGQIITSRELPFGEHEAGEGEEGEAGDDVKADSSFFKKSVAQFEKDLIMKALRDANGNRSKAAEMLGIYRRLLYAKIKEYGLEGYPPKGR